MTLYLSLTPPLLCLSFPASNLLFTITLSSISTPFWWMICLSSECSLSLVLSLFLSISAYLAHSVNHICTQKAGLARTPPLTFHTLSISPLSLFLSFPHSLTQSLTLSHTRTHTHRLSQTDSLYPPNQLSFSHLKSCPTSAFIICVILCGCRDSVGTVQGLSSTSTTAFPLEDRNSLDRPEIWSDD